MPNGGSDCCGTCWFNTANEGDPDYRKGPPPDEVRCTIRSLEIETPFWTYCANHPHHNPARVEVPIGPVYVTDGYPYTRRVLEQSPDTEEIRAGLLDLLGHMEEVPNAEYPTPTELDEEVIKQLMEFREKRAAPTLRTIIHFDPLAAPDGDNPFGQNRVTTVALAVEALVCIEGDSALDEVETALRCGLSRDAVTPDVSGGILSRIRQWWLRKQANPDDQAEDPMAAIRYHAVLGLKHCGSDRARILLREATNDPHPEVAMLARRVLTTKEADT
ncbi:MAG: cellulose biosynthesis cyclic di-GMP-binding regulatory protein BcsB [Planctomycetes bacterium]|nr:cellulose biosynthesis cyclic di-GMP-binding regulatory protein BcsB [Planctomycetota bacterium]